MIDAVLRALGMAFAMGWEILWPLIVGFTLSAVVQAVVSHREMARLAPGDRPRSTATAPPLWGGASEMASTNLVAELSIIMLAFLGWQLTLPECVCAPIVVRLLLVLFLRLRF